jgi:N-acetylglucosamine-6-phosphate deacetylase
MKPSPSAIINGRIVLDGKIVTDKILLFADKIIDIVEDVIVSDNDNMTIIDAKGAYVSAGFIDLHIHGSAGADVMDATPEALENISTMLPSTGTTSFLATTMTMSPKAIDNALQNIQTSANGVTGAEILGIHLEGPFINPSKHGAQNKIYIQEPNLTLIEKYIDNIKMITLAPEVQGCKNFIEKLSRDYPHIILSIGHSDASYEETRESFTWGISHATHLFNAMNVYHHRKPGIVGAVFDSDITCDVIADMVHTHASTLELVQKMKKEKLILITDAMRAGCMKCGTYDLGGQSVEVKKGKALLADGTLAGSVLKMNEALENMTKYTSMTFIDVVHAVTKIPAQKLGIQKGELKHGYDADIVIFDDNFSIMSTYIKGKGKYRCLDF